MKKSSTPSNANYLDQSSIINGEEKQRLEMVEMCDAHMQYLSWEAVCLEIGYVCSSMTVRSGVKYLKYHRRAFRRKLAMCLASCPIRQVQSPN